MALIAPLPARDLQQEDHRIVLRNVDWEVYEQLLAIRGDSLLTRMAYCEGALELMSPSTSHERIKKTLARLLELHALARGIDLYAVGSWTIKDRLRERGIEPDECYSLGNEEPVERPDLAIEVVWTSGGLDKLAVYAGLGVPEVWIWEAGRITVYGLREASYVALGRSELLPDFDVEHVLPYLLRTDQPAAVREYWAWLQGAGA